MRLPIVSTDVDGLGEVLKNGSNALVVNSGNATALAEAVCDLLNHPEKADSLASAALETSKLYDIEKTVERMETVYDQLLKETPISRE